MDKITTGFELAIRESQFANRLCLFADHFKQFFMKFANQNLPSIGTFVFKETTKFLITLQARQFTYFLLQYLHYFLAFGWHFGPKPQKGKLLANHFWKDNSNPFIKNKRGMELVTSHSSGYKTVSEKFLY